MNKKKIELHWDNIYKTKDYTQVLWHQNIPKVSLELIELYSKKNDFIIDVGCGASFLVDNLISLGYKNITLLDTSETSLNIVKQRLKKDAVIPTYICSDINNFIASKKFDMWHDRAVFHFLLLKEDRINYFDVLQNSLQTDGVAIINTFSTGGQTQCAGLKIVQYDYEKMIQELPSVLECIKFDNYTHVTPKGTQQKYSYFILKKAN